MRLTRPSCDQYPGISRLYRQWGEKAKCGKLDSVYTLTDQRGRPCAAARVLPRAGNVFLLRNLTVDPACRRRGLARQLMQGVLQDTQIQPLYCYALDYLQEFYTDLGFCTLPVCDVPQSIAGPFMRYRASGKSFVLMGYAVEQGANCV